MLTKNPMPLSQALRKESHVLWTISLIQDRDETAQTKTELAEMAGDVSQTEPIRKVTLCLADRLQRFRLMILHNISESEAIQRCETLAHQWQQDNEVTLTTLGKTKEMAVLTWQSFLEWSDYPQTILDIEKFYQTHREFKHDVDGRIRQELDNLKLVAKLSDPVTQTKLIKQYIFEECAFQKFAATQGFDYELYKTPMSKAMRRIKKTTEFVPPGFMTEVFFTQFDSSKKKPVLPTPPIHSNGGEFNGVFSPLNGKKPLYSAPSLEDPGANLARFVESTISLLPSEQRAEAIQNVIKFMTETILFPLSRSNVLKI